MQEDASSHPSSTLGLTTRGVELSAQELDMGEELSPVRPQPDDGVLLRNHPGSDDRFLATDGVSTASAARLSTLCHSMVFDA